MKYIELNNKITVKKNGFYNIEKDFEAIDDYLENEVGKKLKIFADANDRIKKLIEEGYYFNFYQWYSEEQINEVDELIRSYNFRFQSFMAVTKFYRDYALKSYSKNHILEDYEARILANALYLARGNFELSKEFAEILITQQYQPATPTFQDAGKIHSGELVSCFLLELDDTAYSIVYNLGVSLKLSTAGGGIALNLSKIRSTGESLRGKEGVASGVLPIMKLLEDTFSFANKMDERKGAGAVYLNVFHRDFLSFLDTKKINADEKRRIQTLSLGVIIPDKFIDLAKNNREIAMFAPGQVFSKYNVHLDDMDMDEMYEILLNDKDIARKMDDPRRILTLIAKTQMESGYPYVIYRSTANKKNPLKNLGKIKMSNLCTEIYQIQETSNITQYGQPDEIKRDISCNLGSLNIYNVMKNRDIEKAVNLSMRMLTTVTDLTSIDDAPGVKKANEELHAVGLGAMNLHGYLMTENIWYESEEAKDFVRTFFSTVNYYSLKTSHDIAVEKDKTFVGFEKSDYATGEYFAKYLSEDFSPKTTKVKKIFEGFDIPTQSDWKKLSKSIRKHGGLYHAYRMAIAPNQSTGYLQNATPSIMPITSHIETRTYATSTTYYPAPFLTKENLVFYKVAYNIDMYKMLDLVKEIQEHVDQGISTTLFVKQETSTRDIVKYYLHAYKIGLKALYYTRTLNTNLEECASCSV